MCVCVRVCVMVKKVDVELGSFDTCIQKREKKT